jgi:hypothetical protein
MGRCMTGLRGRGRTTPGFVGSGSRAGRSRSCSTSATAGCSTRRPGGTRSTRRFAELAAMPQYVDVVERLVCLRGVSTLTAFALTVELGDWNRFRPASLGPFLGLTPIESSSGGAAPSGRDQQDRQHERATASDRGRLAPAPAAAQERHARTQTRGQTPRRASPSRAQRSTAARALARARGSRQAAHDRRGRRRPRARRTLLGARDDGVADPQRLGEESAPAHRREERPERTLGAAHSGPRSTPENGPAPHHRTPVMRHQPAHMSRDTTVDDSRCAPPADS